MIISEIILTPFGRIGLSLVSTKSERKKHPLVLFESCETQQVGCDFLLHFVAFFHVASLFSTGVDNKKCGVDNEKALELTNSTVFHMGRQ